MWIMELIHQATVIVIAATAKVVQATLPIAMVQIHPMITKLRLELKMTSTTWIWLRSMLRSRKLKGKRTLTSLSTT